MVPGTYTSLDSKINGAVSTGLAQLGRIITVQPFILIIPLVQELMTKYQILKDHGKLLLDVQDSCPKKKKIVYFSKKKNKKNGLVS